MSNRVISRRGRIRALLAGGLVLGLGAAITLAAWNDSEFATGTFGAGTFNLEGTELPGETFTDHDVPPGAALTFSLLAGNLSPGDSVYAPFAVRLEAGTTNDATVTMTTEDTDGGLVGLTYEVVMPTTFGCGAVTGGPVLVAADTPIATTPAATTFPVFNGATDATPGDTVNLCFKVTAEDNLAQGEEVTVVWEFNAVSLA